ncbi:MAG: hypothetical protein ABW184_10670 [Sphingobium sp.]
MSVRHVSHRAWAATLLPLAMLFLPQPAVTAPRTKGFGPKDSWWVCDHLVERRDGGAALLSSMTRLGRKDGSLWSDDYQMRVGAVRLWWGSTGPSGDGLPRLQALRVQTQGFPGASDRGLYATMFGDRVLVARTTMLSPAQARRGQRAAAVVFEGAKLTGLAGHDRWTLVVQGGGGDELLRRELPVPGRAAREALFAAHRGAMNAAWAERDERRAIGALAPDRAAMEKGVCLISTPAARAAADAAMI